MSNQRNADKDRELLQTALSNPLEFLGIYGDIILHWLERAAAAEQKVAELDKVVQTVKNELTAWNDAENARAVVLEYLVGLESKDRP